MNKTSRHIALSSIFSLPTLFGLACGSGIGNGEYIAGV